MATFTNYTPPGVYVQDESNPIVTATNAPSGLVCIVGPARGYQQDTEVVPIYSNVSGGTVLRHRGIYTTAVTGPPAISAPVVTRRDGTPLILDSDYALVVDNTTYPGGNRNQTVAVVRLADDPDQTQVSVASPSGVEDGEPIVVSYQYADLAYHSPQALQEYDYVTALYGQPFTTAGQVDSPLTVAARIAFANGATEILCVALDPSDGTMAEQFVSAYAKVANDYRVATLVPLFVDGLDQGGSTSDTHTSAAFETLADDLQAHCENAAAEGFGRIGIAGPPANYDESGVALDQLGPARSSKRLVIAYPNRVNLSVNNTILEVGGYYLAAAYGALLVAGKTNRGLTKRIISGFAGIPNSVQQAMTPSYKDRLSQSGVAVSEVDRLNRFICRHGVTTKVSDLLSREISLVRIADTMYQTVQGGLDAADLIGEPIDAEMTTRVKGVISGILERAVSDDLIISWQDLKVRQMTLPSGDPTVIECKFAYKAAVPLNYINVGFRIDLTSGVITETAA